MNSRRLALQWQFPRYKVFERHVRTAASNWFKEKGYMVHSKMPYCVSSLDDWKKNIILEEVADYVEKLKMTVNRQGNHFRYINMSIMG